MCAAAPRESGAPTSSVPQRRSLRAGGDFAARADFLDRGLAAALANLFAGVSVVELGAGKGCYAAYLRRAPPPRHGESRIGVRAFDGAPNVVNLTGGLVTRADLTSPLVRMPPSEWVLCLETAEHSTRTPNQRGPWVHKSAL